MTRRSTVQLLLALTFAVGQWLTVVHGVEHQLSGADKLVSCEICVAGHAAAGPPALATLPATPIVAANVRLAATVPARKQQRFHRPPTRGPPSFSSAA